MITRTVTLLALALGAIACGKPAVASGSSGSGGASTSTSTDTGTHGLTMPPVYPPGTGTVTLAVSQLFFGDTDRDGTPDPLDGWRRYGFDLDGKVSTAASTDLCKPRDTAAPKDVYPDGDGGIDNAFGHRLVPILRGLAADFTAQQSSALTSGQQTLLFAIVGVDQGASYDPILTRVYLGAPLGAAPKLDGSDTWPVDPASLADPGDVASATAQFPLSYLMNNTWAAAPKGKLTLPLVAGGVQVQLALESALVTATLDASHGSAVNGTIAGVLPLATLIPAVQRLLVLLSPDTCTVPPAMLLAQIEQAADILADGTQDPTKPCDAISIGVGFNAVAAHLGAVGPPAPPPKPCP